jgi:hypothetical protein
MLGNFALNANSATVPKQVAKNRQSAIGAANFRQNQITPHNRPEHAEGASLVHPPRSSGWGLTVTRVPEDIKGSRNRGIFRGKAIRLYRHQGRVGCAVRRSLIFPCVAIDYPRTRP